MPEDSTYEVFTKAVKKYLDNGYKISMLNVTFGCGHTITIEGEALARGQKPFCPICKEEI